MARYILIDNGSGFIFGDTADLKGYEHLGQLEHDAIQAARLVDENEVGVHGRSYEFQRANPRDTRTVLGMCLSAIASGPIQGAPRFGVFRM